MMCDDIGFCDVSQKHAKVPNKKMQSQQDQEKSKYDMSLTSSIIGIINYEFVLLK
jgi:hypothetical protein